MHVTQEMMMCDSVGKENFEIIDMMIYEYF